MFASEMQMFSGFCQWKLQLCSLNMPGGLFLFSQGNRLKENCKGLRRTVVGAILRIGC